MARCRDLERSARIVTLRHLQQNQAAIRLAQAAALLTRATVEHDEALSRLDEEQQNWENILARRSLDLGLAAVSAGSVNACAEQARECEEARRVARGRSSDCEGGLKMAMARSEAAEAAAANASRHLKQKREEIAAAALEDRVAGDYIR